MAASRLRGLAEMAADDFVVREKMEAVGYASSLLAVSEEIRGMRLPQAAEPMARTGSLKMRLKNILSDTVKRDFPGRGVFSFILLSVVLVVACAASVRLGVAADPAVEEKAKDSMTILVQRMPDNPGRKIKVPIARLEATSAENIQIISSAFKSAIELEKKVYLSGQHSTFIQIDIQYRSERISLSSVHPVYESGGAMVETSKSLQILGKRTIEEVVRNQPESYQQFRQTFDTIYMEVVGAKFRCMSQIFE